ncbi:hypothetical protein CJ030_MR6G020522 [Morella rubra]|uniref:Putative plant transposon protein domain-containing protein n=1 Tax=Morella rubra TaxID=262757 RepID=A0A6A1VAP5_9ROSI|nr:hypothetical protein CJ030_MR6G020522 [Morella rubra]
MSKRARTSSQADDEQSSARTLTVEQHTAIIMSRSIVVERDIKLADFNDLTFEGRTLPEVVEGLGWLPLIHRTGYASKNMVREFYCSILRARDLEEPSMELTVRNVPIIFSPDELRISWVRERFDGVPKPANEQEGRPTKAEVFRTMLGDDTTFWRDPLWYTGSCFLFGDHALILCSSIDPKKHTTELSYSRAEFLYLAVVRGLPVDIASYIYLSIRAEALKTDATISLPHGILLTQFLHAMMVPESGDEPRALPLGSINKTTLSKSIAQTRERCKPRVARVRRQEQPEEAMEGRILGRARLRDLGHSGRVGWTYDDGAVSADGIGLAAHPLHGQ